MELLDNGIRVGLVLVGEPRIKVFAIGGISFVSPRNDTRSLADLEEKTSGRIKFNNAQSSCRLFCNGVPVIRSRPRLTNVLMICERSESTFLIRCASSMMMYSQLNFLSVDFSLMHISYDVMRMSNFCLRTISVTMLAYNTCISGVHPIELFVRIRDSLGPLWYPAKRSYGSLAPISRPLAPNC